MFEQEKTLSMSNDLGASILRLKLVDTSSLLQVGSTFESDEGILIDGDQFPPWVRVRHPNRNRKY